MRSSSNTSLRTTLILWFGVCLILLAIVLTAAAVLTQRNQTTKSAQNEVLAIAKSQASRIDAEIEVALDTARTLANAFASVLESSTQGEPLSREQVNQILYQTLAKNPNFLGVYTAWEPNAFDGLDNQFRNTPGHDGSGRFVPYIVRSGANI
ncbi:MAG: cache domain-containing protein, partial [Anaerolineales bacterium]|nr:cache domain-containing protein [Anaerolineales bacterium]